MLARHIDVSNFMEFDSLNSVFRYGMEEGGRRDRQVCAIAIRSSHYVRSGALFTFILQLILLTAICTKLHQFVYDSTGIGKNFKCSKFGRNRLCW